MKSSAQSSPEILQLEDCVGAKVPEVGRRTYDLLQLLRGGIPLPETYVFPATLLEQIVHFNHLSQTLEKIFTVTPWSNPQAIAEQSRIAQEYILHAKIPDSFAHEFAKAYGQWMENEFFAIRPSFLTDTTNTEHLSELHVTGEVHLLESLLRVWAHTYQPEQFAMRYQEWQRGQIVPAALIAQRMVRSTSSGICLMGELTKGGLTRLKIYSTWGTYLPNKIPTSEMDYFEADPKHENTVYHQLKVKKQEFVHQRQALNLRDVSPARQAEPSLTHNQLASLLQLLRQLSKQIFTPHRVEWAFEGDRLYILTLQEEHWNTTAPSHQHLSPPAHAAHISPSEIPTTKKFVQIQESHDLATERITSLSGVVFASDKTFLQLGVHPSYLLQHQRAAVVKDALVKEMRKIMSIHPQWMLVYRPQNLTVDKLLKLKQGGEYELPEPNPYLGYRGAIRNIHNYHLLDVELDALADIYEVFHPKLRILLPFIRDAAELKMIQKHLHHPQFTPPLPAQTWLECNVPASVVEIEHYLQYGVGGVVFNITDLHALLHGIDPHHPDIFKLYPLKLSLLQSLLKDTVALLKKRNVTVLLSGPKDDTTLMELASSVGTDGVVVL